MLQNPTRPLIAMVVFLLLTGQIGRIRKTTGIVAGGILLPVFGLMFFPSSLKLLLILIFSGVLAGFLLSSLVGIRKSGHSPSSMDQNRAFFHGWASGQWRSVKKPVKQFLSSAERKKIQKAVKDAEQLTSGKIAAMILPASQTYPLANVIGATAVSLPLALVFTPVISEGLGLYAQDMWVFAALFCLLFSLLFALIDLFPWFKRVFISSAEMETATEDAAATAFFKQGLYRAKGDAGVLIFISILERRVFVLAGRGITEKTAGDQWQRIVRHILGGMGQNRRAKAILEAVGMVGKLLKTHFPAEPIPVKREKGEG